MDFLHGDDWFPDARFPVAVYHGYHVDEFPVHIHDFSELVMVTSGSAHHRVRGERYRIYAGHVFVVRGMVPHGYDDARDLKLSQIILDEKFLLERFPEIRSVEGFETLFYLQPEAEAHLAFESRMCLGADFRAEIDDEIRELTHELAERYVGYETMALSMIGRILVRLCRYYSSIGPLNDPSLVGIAKATSHIHHNYASDISLDDLCEVACMSRRSLTRHFGATVGEPPIRYLNRVRAERAAGLIRTTGYRFTEIAAQVGFTDSNYFSRVFRTVYDMSPRAYAHEDREEARRRDARPKEAPEYLRLVP